MIPLENMRLYQSIIIIYSNKNVSYLWPINFAFHKMWILDVQYTFMFFTDQGIQTSSAGALVPLNMETPAFPVKPTLPANTGETLSKILMQRTLLKS